MTISELIVELQSLKCEHGDLPVVFWDDRERHNLALGVNSIRTLLYIMRGH